jgi:Carboxypeptidase regulatory-like domain/TonB-dependent Receptor Plug Domain
MHARFQIPTSLALLIAASPATIHAATSSSATVAGRILDERQQPVPGARVVLLNKVSGYRQVARSDAKGGFTFHNVPFNDYHLEASAQGLEMVHRNLELRSSLPKSMDLLLHPVGTTVVVEEKLGIVEEHPSTHLDIDKSTIESSPAPVQSRAMESILLATPGFTQNADGRYHFRGSHGQVMFVVDGVPITDQMNTTFSNSLDPSQVESMEVLTGGISAEYGGKPVAVVNMTTKSGLGTPGGFEGDLTLGAASFKTSEASLSVRGGGDRFGYFVTGAASQSDRFLDSVSFDNYNNHGSTGRIFSRFDWVLSDQDTLRASISGGDTHRRVMNLASQQLIGQDQKTATSDHNVSLAWTHLFSSSQSVDVSAFYRPRIYRRAFRLGDRIPLTGPSSTAPWRTRASRPPTPSASKETAPSRREFSTWPTPSRRISSLP